MLEPGVVDKGRFPADRVEAAPILEPGVNGRGLLGVAEAEPADGTEFAMELVFSGSPGDRVADKRAPGDRGVVFPAPFPIEPGARAIIAPRDAAAAGERAKAGIDEEAEVVFDADLGVLGVEGPFGG